MTVTFKICATEVKIEFVAVKLIGVVTGDAGFVGVPEITPVTELKDKPEGKGVAAKEMGDLEAVIVYGVIATPPVKVKGAKELVITGL